MSYDETEFDPAEYEPAEPSPSTERLETMARRLVDKKREKVRTKSAADRAAREYLDEERAFWEAMYDRFGKAKTFTLDLGEGYGEIQFVRSESVTGRVLDGEAAKAALEELGWADEILDPAAVRKKVLNSRVRELLKSGQELPEGIDFNRRRFVTISEKGG